MRLYSRVFSETPLYSNIFTRFWNFDPSREYGADLKLRSKLKFPSEIQTPIWNFHPKLRSNKRKTSNNNATDVQQTSNTDVTGQVAVDAKLTSRASVWGSHMLPLDDVISVSSFFHAHYMLPTRKTKKSFFSHFAIVVQDSNTFILWLFDRLPIIMVSDILQYILIH